jgi:vacuolar-type H+-ATPase subunit H
MLDEVIKEIKAAEEDADRLQREAYDEGKRIVFDAENEAEKRKKDTFNLSKTEMREAIAKAKSDAEAETARILERGRAEADAFYNKLLPEAEKLADETVSVFLKRYGI